MKGIVKRKEEESSMRHLSVTRNLVQILVLSLLAAFTACRNSTATPSQPVTDSQDGSSTRTEGSLPGIDIDGYKLVFHDEFEGSRVDLTKWAFQSGTNIDGNPNNAWGNQEAQYYKDDNAPVSDGTLKITAKRERAEFTWDGRQYFQEYTSARLRTHGKFSAKYGRFEARIKSPAITGLWPAFWMMPEMDIYGGWPRSGEIDIMEAKGRLPNQVGQAIHFAMPDEQHNYHHRYIHNVDNYTFPNGGRIDEFHTYRLDWSPKQMEWFVDNELIYSVHVDSWKNNFASSQGSADAPFDHEFHMLLNLAVGGMFDEHKLPSEDFVSAAMEIDYVRVWQKIGDVQHR